jgi:peroxiredoxin Q/BCP
MLKIGDQAPDFTARASNGETVSLSAMRGKPVVVYFFPKAFTMGCTGETRRFREGYEDIRKLGAEIIGISPDQFDTQRKFAGECKVQFLLISDEDKRISDAFGVLWPLIKIPQRITFVIDEDGLVQAVFHHEVQIARHFEDVKRFLEQRRGVAHSAT